MAENSAHLTQTAQIKPSIFDFVAQERLNDLLHPSAKKVIDTLALRHNSFAKILKWFDEYFLVCHFLLQFYYLKKYGATFSEKFYGLQRVSIKGSSNSSLGNKEFFLSLLIVSLFPYLKLKLNAAAEKMSLDILPRTNQREKIIFMKSVINFNSSFNIWYQLVKFIQHLRYLSGKSDINSPLLWASSVKLKYANEEGAEANSITFRNFIPQILLKSLEISAFFIQFFQWWQTEKGNNLSVLPIPPPPQKSRDGVMYSDKCPICLNKRNIHTVLSTSGFVFCFKCITSYLMEHNKCPVTELPATINNLIRVYPLS